MTRAGVCAASRSAPLRSASASPITDASVATSARRPPPLPGGRTMRSPRSGLRPLAPRNNSPLCRMPSPRLRSTSTTRKSFRSRACPNQCSARVTRLTSLSIDVGAPSRLERSAPNGTSRSLQDRALATDARGALHDARQSDANTGYVGELEAGVADAPPHAVLHEIGDDGRGLAVDADRHRQRAQDVGAKVGDRHRDLVGREFHSDDMAASGLSFSMTRGRPRPASPRRRPAAG